MATFDIFYVRLTPEQAAKIDGKGWTGPEGRAFLDAVGGSRFDYGAAIRAGMLKHVASVIADNHHRAQASISAQFPRQRKISGARSHISTARPCRVGDIIVERGKHPMRVSIFGFDRLHQEDADLFVESMKTEET